MAKVMAFTALVATSLTVAAAVFGAKSQPYHYAEDDSNGHYNDFVHKKAKPYPSVADYPYYEPYPSSIPEPHYEPYPSSSPEHFVSPSDGFGHYFTSVPYTSATASPDVDTGDLGVTPLPSWDVGYGYTRSNTVPHVITEPDVSVTPDFYYEDIHYTPLPSSEGGNEYTAPYVTTAPDASVTPGFYYEDIYYTPLPSSEGGNEYTITSTSPHITIEPEASVTPVFDYEDILYTPPPSSEIGYGYGYAIRSTVRSATAAPEASASHYFDYTRLSFTPHPSQQAGDAVVDSNSVVTTSPVPQESEDLETSPYPSVDVDDDEPVKSVEPTAVGNQNVNDVRPIESRTPFPSKHESGHAPTKTPSPIYTNGVDADACYLKTFNFERGIGEYCCPEEFSCESDNCSNSYECKSSTRKYDAYCLVVKCQQVHLRLSYK